MEFDVLNYWTGRVQFTAEIECEADATHGVKIGLAVRWALQQYPRANLTGADLRDANLTGANLTGANLTDANLRDANLTDANLRDANLTRANLTGANLTRANLTDANLTRANLTGANLTDANLTDANLTDANLRQFKSDMWLTLSENKAEVPALIAALKEGRVDGSQYDGECACLVGTLANAKSVSHMTLTHNSNNPAERWFMMIRKGDKPGDGSGGGFASKMAVEWAEEFCRVHGVEVPNG